MPRCALGPSRAAPLRGEGGRGWEDPVSPGCPPQLAGLAPPPRPWAGLPAVPTQALDCFVGLSLLSSLSNFGFVFLLLFLNI